MPAEDLARESKASRSNRISSTLSWFAILLGLILLMITVAFSLSDRSTARRLGLLTWHVNEVRARTDVSYGFFKQFEFFERTKHYAKDWQSLFDKAEEDLPFDPISGKSDHYHFILKTSEDGQTFFIEAHPLYPKDGFRSYRIDKKENRWYHESDSTTWKRE